MRGKKGRGGRVLCRKKVEKSQRGGILGGGGKGDLGWAWESNRGEKNRRRKEKDFGGGSSQEAFLGVTVGNWDKKPTRADGGRKVV